MKNIYYVLMAVFAVAIVAGIASAVTPSVITGTVFFSNSSVVPGANVTVICQHLGVNSTGTDVTLIDGTYYVVFDETQCGFNDRAWVTASFDGMTGTNTGLTCGNESCPIPVGLINVTIPEFTLVGTLVVILAGLGIIVYRKNR